MEIINRCPFCGGEAKLERVHIDTDLQFADDIHIIYVTCTECGAIGRSIYLRNAYYRATYKEEFNKAEKEAIDAWNAKVGKENNHKYDIKMVTRGRCMMCGKDLTEGLFFCKECEEKIKSNKGDKDGE